jgi:hypothetical protein
VKYLGSKKESSNKEESCKEESYNKEKSNKEESNKEESNKEEKEIRSLHPLNLISLGWGETPQPFFFVIVL